MSHLIICSWHAPLRRWLSGFFKGRGFDGSVFWVQTGSSGNALLDLTGLDTSLSAPTLDPALSLLDDELMSLGEEDTQSQG